jgi:uncharacterized protein (DUF849 family)
VNRLAQTPNLMVAPNGGRRTRRDHAGLPLTIAETVEAARTSFAAGANALHAHVRDKTGAHSLDPGAYQELIAAMAAEVPDMPVQITTEAIGMFTADQQRQTVLEVNPEGASVAIREMWPAGETGGAARKFYRDCADRGIAIQHIAHAPEDFVRILDLAAAGDLPGPLQVIFVLGSYTSHAPARPEDLMPYLEARTGRGIDVDWAVCAFGPGETQCLLEAHRQSGKMRIGLENNFVNADGSMAETNAERVTDLVMALERQTLATGPVSP